MAINIYIDKYLCNSIYFCIQNYMFVCVVAGNLLSTKTFTHKNTQKQRTKFLNRWQLQNYF